MNREIYSADIFFYLPFHCCTLLKNAQEYLKNPFCSCPLEKFEKFFFKQLDKNWQSYLIAAAALIVTLFTDFNVIFLILAGGIYGIVYTLARDARKKKLLEKNLDGGESAAAEEDGAERVDQACGGAEESGEDKQ